MLLALAYSYQKVQRGLLDLMSPSDRQITINSTYAFTTHTLRRDLGFNPFRVEIST
jgi:hypothetical protein